jgi:hypothetical protein
MMKKTVMWFVWALSLSGCDKGEPVYIPVEIIFRELKPVEKGVEPSFATESAGDTLKCRIVTKDMRTPAELQSIKAYIAYHVLQIRIETTPNDFPPSDLDSFGTMHEISFDLLKLKHRTYRVETVINSHHEERAPVNHSN